MRFNHSIDELDFSHIHGFWHWVEFIAAAIFISVWFVIQLKIIDFRRQEREKLKKASLDIGKKP